MHELKQLSTSDNLIARRAKRKGQAMVIRPGPNNRVSWWANQEARGPANNVS